MDRLRQLVDGTDRMDRFEELVVCRGTWRHIRVLRSRVSRLGTGLRRAAGEHQEDAELSPPFYGLCGYVIKQEAHPGGPIHTSFGEQGGRESSR